MNSSTISNPSASHSPAPAAAQPPAELLTQVQLSRMLGISRRTLANWVRDKVVPMIKIRGFCRFEYAKVRAALELCERAAAGSSQESAAATDATASSQKSAEAAQTTAR